MASYLLVAAPLISRQTDVLRRAGLKLSEVLVLSLAGANQEALRQGDEMMINVKQMAGVEGVTAVYVYDLAGRTLAPVSQLHKVPADPTSQAALAADKVLIQPLGDDVYDLAAPIRVFNIKAGKFQKVGTARVVISLKELEGLSREAWLASLVSLILMLACAAAAGLLISRVTYRPINDLRMELEAALKGDQEQVTPARGFGPLVGLAESLNRAVAKLDKAAAPAPAAAPAGPPAGARAELKALVRVSPGAVLAADADNQVIYASPAYCRAMRVEASQVEGGHLLEAVGDKKLLAALLELVKQSLESGGEPRSGAAVMDDGAQVEMTACAVAGPGAEPGAIAISFQGLGQEAAS
jgi:PAS domain-containing protein